MSLDDELSRQMEKSTKANPTDIWLNQWYAKLSAKDKTTWDNWLYHKPGDVAAMHRALLEGYEFPFQETTFRQWVRKQRHRGPRR